MNVGSLFSGIGGFDLGLERAGMSVVWQCERDPYRRAVLARWWPHVPCYGDIRGVSAELAARVDVVCGGFPCTDLSLAGKGAGLDGEQSGLWTEMLRVVRELRPRYVIVENVAALLGRGLGRVLGDLAESGFDAEWDCIPASAFGAPHRRDRLWIVAYADSEQHEVGPPSFGRATAEELRPHPDAGGFEVNGQRNGQPFQPGLEASQRHDADGFRSHVADANRKRLRTVAAQRCDPAGLAASGDEPAFVQDPDLGTVQPRRIGRGAAQAGSAEWWAAEPDVGRVAHGVPNRLDRLAALGDSLVPQIAEWIGRRIMSYEQHITTHTKGSLTG